MPYIKYFVKVPKSMKPHKILNFFCLKLKKLKLSKSKRQKNTRKIQSSINQRPGYKPAIIWHKAQKLVRRN